MSAPEPMAYLGGMRAQGLVDLTRDPGVLEADGWWAVVLTFEGELVAARFADVRPAPHPGGPWRGPAVADWHGSLGRAAYLAAVARVREHIADGTVYQANVCRVLRAQLPDPDRADVAGLAALLATGNPAPYAGVVRLPAGAHRALPDGLHVVSASPELFLRRRGVVVESGPIKGTGRTVADLTDKDRAENVMIVDLVRNDLGAVAHTGSVSVPHLLAAEPHPGLVHLVSTVRAELAPGVGWPEILAATFPPGSVSGAPKSSALRVIGELEPVPRGPYCGAIGWVAGGTGGSTAARHGVLAVGIRTFWREGDELCFGTGAGITWGSDPVREWEETELKAHRLLSVAAGTWEGGPP